MKKFAVGFVMVALSGLAFAGGCWQNGKYVQCVKAQDTTQPGGCWQNGKYVQCVK